MVFSRFLLFVIVLHTINTSLISRKDGEDELCRDGLSSWGCLHSGSASVSKSISGEGDYSNLESTEIINGGSGTFLFEVQQSNDLADEVNDVENLIASTLEILVNEEPKAAFRHTSFDGHNLEVVVRCDQFCNCVIEKKEICSLHAVLEYPQKPGEFGYKRDE